MKSPLPYAAAFLTALRFDQENVTTFLARVADLAFPECNYLIYIKDESPIASHAEKALMAGENPKKIFVVTMGYMLDDEIPDIDPDCDGYVIATGNASSADLDALFLEEYRRSYFKVHKPTLVFCGGFGDFQRTPFTTWAGLLGAKLFVVEGLGVDPGHPHGDDIRVTFVRTAETVGTYRMQDGHGMIDLGKFKVGDFEPNFTAAGAFHVMCNHCWPFFGYDVDEETDTVDEKTTRGLTNRIIGEVAKARGWPIRYHQPREIHDGVPLNIYVCGTSMGLFFEEDITIALFPRYYSVLVPKPELLPESSFVYQPFQMSLWFLIAAFSLAMGGHVYLIAAIWKKVRGEDLVYLDGGLSLLHAVRFLTSGSISSFPDNIFVVLALASWSIACVILATAYSAGFSTSLTAPRYTRPIETLKDIADQQLPWLIKQRFFYEHHLNINPITKPVLDLAIVEPDDDKALALFASRRLGVFAESHFTFPNPHTYLMYPVGYAMLTRLKYAAEYLEHDHIVYLLERNSPFKPLIDGCLLRYLEHGFVEAWYEEAAFVRGAAFMDVYGEGYETRELGKGKMQGAFYLLCLGLGASALAFLGEVFKSAFLTRLTQARRPIRR